jgi:flagellar hook-length control protein FliK
MINLNLQPAVATAATAASTTATAKTAGNTGITTSPTDNSAQSTQATSSSSDFASMLGTQLQTPADNQLIANQLSKLAQQLSDAGQPVTKDSLSQALSANVQNGSLPLTGDQVNQMMAAIAQLPAGDLQQVSLSSLLGKSTSLTSSVSSELSSSKSSSDKSETTADSQDSTSNLPVMALYAMLGMQTAQLPTQTTASNVASDASVTEAVVSGSGGNASTLGLTDVSASTLAGNKLRSLSTAQTSQFSLDKITAGTDTTALTTDSTLSLTSTTPSTVLTGSNALNTIDSTNSNSGSVDSSMLQQMMGQVQNFSSQSDSTSSANASTGASGQLTAALGSNDWQQSLSQQIVMFTHQGQQTAQLHLHPEDLGSIQISMKITDNQAQLHFVSGHSDVRAAIESAMPQLRSALADNGISLGQSSVGGDASQWQQAAQQQMAQSGSQQQSGNGSNWANFVSGNSNGNTVSETLTVPASIQSLASGNGAVDTFA